MSEPAEKLPETEAPQELTAIDPRGKEYTVPSGQAGYFAKRGWTVETPEQTAARQLEKEQGFGGAVKAFGENALSTGTIGLSDVAAGAIGGNEYRRNRALRELAYPTASTAGEITGMVLPALATGGESAAAEGVGALAEGAEAAEGASALSRAAELGGKAVSNSPAGWVARAGEGTAHLAGGLLEGAGLTGGSALSRAALAGGKLAAAGGVEGALFGAGSALSEAALAPDGDYDGLAQKLWAGGLEGAEFGAVTGGALGVGGSLLASGARKLAGSYDAARSLREFSDAATLKRVGLQGSDIQKMSPEVRAARADFIREGMDLGWLDTVQDASAKLREAKDQVGELLGNMRRELDVHALPGEGPNLRSVISDAETHAADVMLKAKTAAEEKAAQKFSEELDVIKKNIGDKPMTFEESHELRRQIDSELTNYGKRTYPTGGTKRPPDLFEQHMMGFRTQLEQEFERAGEQVMQRASSHGVAGEAPGLTEDWRNAYHEAKQNYGAAKELEKISTKRSGSLAGNSAVGLRDAIFGGAGLAALGPKGIALAAVSKVLRSAPAVDVVGRIAGHLATLDDKIANAANKWMGRARKAERGAEAVASAPSRSNVAKRILEKTQEVTKSTAHAGLHVNEGAAEQREKMSEYWRKVAAVEREAKSPVGTLAHVEGAPQTAAAMDKVRRNAANYLLENAPRQPATISNPVIARMARQTPPSPSEMSKWMLRVRTVENPMSVVHDIENGRLKKAQVETLAATAPVLLDQIRKSVLAHVTDSDADITYAARIQLGTLLDIETDPSLRPESIRLYQQTYQNRRAQSQAQQQGQPAAPSVPGRSAIGANSRLDQLEEGNIQ